ncbi:hypothetical protein FRC07_011007, partial [Ceratobasidium sp. 392]
MSSDEIGEQEQKISRELAVKDEKIKAMSEELARVTRELADKSSELANTQVELREAKTQMADQSAGLLRIKFQKNNSDMKREVAEQNLKVESLQTKVATLERLLTE